MTMICVTHEMGFARTVADTVVFMDKGQVVEVAPPGRVLRQPEERTDQAVPQPVAEALSGRPSSRVVPKPTASPKGPTPLPACPGRAGLVSVVSPSPPRK